MQKILDGIITDNLTDKRLNKLLLWSPLFGFNKIFMFIRFRKRYYMNHNINFNKDNILQFVIKMATQSILFICK